MKKSKTLSKIVGWLALPLDFFYPQSCFICDSKNETASSFCTICLKSISEQEFIEFNDDCLDQRFSLYKFTKEVRQTVHGLKYNSLPQAAVELFDIGSTKLYSSQKLANCDIIVPVPLFWYRKMSRGYNQAELLANSLSKASQIQVVNVLKRKRHTTTQTKKRREERAKNISGAFSVRKIELVANKSIILIDDVFTTGATTRECAKELIASGAKSVAVITLAYA